MLHCCYCLTTGAWGTANNKPNNKRHCLTPLSITQSVNSSETTHIKKKTKKNSTIPGTLYSPNPLEEKGLPACFKKFSVAVNVFHH